MNRSDISRLAALSTLLVIFTSAVVGVLLFIGMSSALREGQMRSAQVELSSALSSFAGRLEGLRRQALALGRTPPVLGLPAAIAGAGGKASDGSTPEQWRRRLAAIFESYMVTNRDVTQIRYIAVNGDELVRVERRGGKDGQAPRRVAVDALQNKADRYYFTQGMRRSEGDVYMSDIDLNVENGKVQVPFQLTLRAATPVDDRYGRRIGLLVINVDAELLMSRITRVAPKGARLHLTNEKGLYLLRPDEGHALDLLRAAERDARKDFPQLEPLFEASGTQAETPAETGEVLTFEKGDSMVHAASVALNPSNPGRRLVAVMLTPRAELFHGIWRYRPQVLAMAGGFVLILLGAGAAFMLSRTLSRTMGQLAVAADRLAEGAPAESIDWPDPRIEEVARLNRALRHLADAVRDRETRLTEREAKLRAIMDSAINGIISMDAEGRIESANTAALEMFGYEEGELIGRNINILMPTPDREAHAGYLARYFRTGERRMICIPREETALRRNGEVFPIELAVSEQVRDGQHAFTGIIVDLSDKKRVERMQRDFVSTVSHELRTPLTAIKGSLDLVGSGALGKGPPAWEDMLALARKNSDRLVRLVNDILDLDRISSGRMQYAFSLEPLSDLVESAVAENRPMAEARGVSVTLETRPDPGALVRADRDRILQVLANLLSNAVKVTPEGAAIRVSARRIGGGWRISVTDAGPGVPEGFRNRIFGKFSQSDNADSARRGGSGLGLHISKAIVEAHQGRIGFDSPPGKSATFWFELTESGRFQPEPGDGLAERAAPTGAAPSDPSPPGPLQPAPEDAPAASAAYGAAAPVPGRSAPAEPAAEAAEPPRAAIGR
ncbi:MAG: hypothetical protein CML46_10110 [Rhodobacteraceae bacterium]|nr:hypothetical protein [Paracoccaceae bacterium]